MIWLNRSKLWRQIKFIWIKWLGIVYLNLFINNHLKYLTLTKIKSAMNIEYLTKNDTHKEKVLFLNLEIFTRS